jgi:hypothetical protein
MKLKISDAVRLKLATKHGGISEEEIQECFANREGEYLVDEREDHLTDPPSLWFVAETNNGRVLKVVFMHYKDTGEYVLKTTYSANPEGIRIYSKYAK